MPAVTRRQFGLRVSGAIAGAALARHAWAQASRSSSLLAGFVLNTQDFAYPHLSGALVTRVLDLHESLDVPVDVYLTTTMVDLFAERFPELVARLRRSPVVSLCYHTRAPVPYRVDYDWLGMDRLSAAEQYDLIREYETHGLDLVTGRPTTAVGSVAGFTDLFGRPPLVVGHAAGTAPVQTSADTVFRDLGVGFAVAHGRAVNAGDRRNGLWLRPEHVDLKLFEHEGEDPRSVLDAALAEASDVEGARAPFVVGIKMHDNDFFAEQSAWTAVYLAPGARRRGPPWDLDRRSALLPPERQEAIWTLYEGTVRHAAALQPRLRLIGARDLPELV